MVETVRVKDGEIFVGKALPWPAYDRNGRLLLQRGETVASRRQLEILLKRGLYRHGSGPGRNPTTLDHARVSPFDLLGDIRRRIAALIGSMVRAQPESKDRAERLIKELQSLCEQSPDAALGSVHLGKQPPYSAGHPLHTAILCELVAKRAGFDASERAPLIGAALTQNLAMAEMQDRLCRQRETLSHDQQAMVDSHPERAVEMLGHAGIDDPIWLAAVAQHHERLDGSGYPGHLSGDAISPQARMLALADRYAAMVSEREYRPALSAKGALRQFFDASQQQFDPQLSVLLIKELGVYPPGSWVRLVNGEIAVVIKRGANATQPTVAALFHNTGGAYVRPMRRDSEHDQFRIADIVPGRRLAFDLATLWGYQ